MQTAAEENLIPERDFHKDDETDFITPPNDGGGGEEEDHGDDYDDEDGEFSFMSFDGELTGTSIISADDAFVNGQIKPIFPLFDQQLVITDRDDVPKNPPPPPVKKIFFQTKQSEDHRHKNLEIDHATTSSSSDGDVISGPYCDLSSRKVVEVTPSSSDPCKKSNSTGFSKIWRFKDFVGRSNSDGRDAFVFLSEAAPLKRTDEKRPPVLEKSTGKVKNVSKRGGKKTASYSAHEAYMRSKVKEDNRRRSSSYLPYKPELMGFFTNVNGGLTKNVHPY